MPVAAVINVKKLETSQKHQMLDEKN